MVDAIESALQPIKDKVDQLVTGITDFLGITDSKYDSYMEARVKTYEAVDRFIQKNTKALHLNTSAGITLRNLALLEVDKAFQYISDSEYEREKAARKDDLQYFITLQVKKDTGAN